MRLLPFRGGSSSGRSGSCSGCVGTIGGGGGGRGGFSMVGVGAGLDGDTTRAILPVIPLQTAAAVAMETQTTPSQR